MAREFQLLSGSLWSGIRQDVSDSQRYMRVLQNMNWQRSQALTKDKGCRWLNPAGAAGSTSGEMVRLFEARFSDGTQKLVAFQTTTGPAALKAYVWNQTTQSFGSALTPTLASTTPCVLMFANKMIVQDGASLFSWTGSGNLTDEDPEDPDVSGDYLKECRFSTIYANRLVLFGSPDYPQQFYPSSVRALVWDASHAYSVMGTRGEAILGACTCGPFLLVGGQEFLRSFYLGTAGPTDWDWDGLSDEIGPINWQSMVEVTRAYGNSSSAFTFFWSKDGPMMAHWSGDGQPSLIPLWRPIQYMVRGEDFQGLAGLDLSAASDIQAAYAPEYDEVRFLVTAKSGSRFLLCVNVSSCVAFVSGTQGAYPMWRTRTFGGGFSPDTISSCEMNPTTGAISTSGVRRCMIGRAGYIHEMDALSYCKDFGDIGGTFIKAEAVWDGIDGAEEEIREYEKSVRKLHVHTTMVGNYTLQVRVIGDGGYSASSGSFGLGNSLSLWGAGAWGTSIWNAGSFVTERADMGCRGHKFQVRIYDDGAVLAPVAIDSWALIGYVEGLR